MSLVNFTTREITCKIVYYGPGRSGKTTNLQHVYSQLPEERKGKMVSLATETDRTLFFDFLPLDLGTISGFATLEATRQKSSRGVSQTFPVCGSFLR